LADLQPKIDNFAQLNTPERLFCFNHIVSILLQTPSRSLRQSLEQLVEGGIEGFLERVPSLQDTSKGGRANLDDLRTRSLPLDLFIDIALAWETWPFRPDLFTIEARLRQQATPMFADG